MEHHMITNEELIRNVYQAGPATENERLLLTALEELVDEHEAFEALSEQQEEADASRIEELETALKELKQQLAEAI
jgi:hypothetical protein